MVQNKRHLHTYRHIYIKYRRLATNLLNDNQYEMKQQRTQLLVSASLHDYTVTVTVTVTVVSAECRASHSAARLPVTPCVNV
jgi:hypothetical protein